MLSLFVQASSYIFRTKIKTPACYFNVSQLSLVSDLCVLSVLYLSCFVIELTLIMMMRVVESYMGDVNQSAALQSSISPHHHQVQPSSVFISDCRIPRSC